MTDLIPRDAAIEAVREYITNSGSELEKWDIDQLLQAMPAIDHAAIREAALRDAADSVRGMADFCKTMGDIVGSRALYSAAAALIGEKK